MFAGDILCVEHPKESGQKSIRGNKWGHQGCRIQDEYAKLGVFLRTSNEQPENKIKLVLQEHQQR